MKRSVVVMVCIMLLVPAMRAQGQSVTSGAAFGKIRGARELGDGTVLVSDGLARTLYVLDATMQTRRQIGRAGDGPGEYRSPADIVAVDGDRSLVLDARNRKWYVLDGTTFLDVPESWRSVSLQWQGTFSGATGNGVMLDGRVHGTRVRVGFPIPRIGDSVAFVRVAAATSRDTVTLGRFYFFGAVRKEFTTPQGPDVTVATHPLNTGDQAWLFPDGRLAIARVSPYRVEWRAPDAQRTVSRVLSDASPPMTSRMKHEVMQRFALDEQGNPKFKPSDFATWPERVPPFTERALVAGLDGRLYVKRTLVGGRRSVDVFDQQRGHVSTVQLPVGADLIAVGRRGWYLARINDDEEYHLVRWTPPVTR